VNILTENRNAVAGSVLADLETRKGLVRPVKEEIALPTRRFDRVSIGLLFGGVTFGSAGCIIGACMPYHHPVARAISVIWWGIYIGCLGAGLGALFVLLTSPHAAVSSLKERSSLVRSTTTRKWKQPQLKSRIEPSNTPCLDRSRELDHQQRRHRPHRV
jgi:hypothetical protein